MFKKWIEGWVVGIRPIQFFGGLLDFFSLTRPLIATGDNHTNTCHVLYNADISREAEKNMADNTILKNG